MPELARASSWLPEAATADHLRAFSVAIYKALSPSTAPAIVQETARHLASRSYTVSEIVYALAVLPHDQKVGASIEHRTPNPYWLLPHVARIIGEAREIRRKLCRLISEPEVFALCQQVPGLERSMFYRGGFNSFDEPLYRFAARPPSISEEARAMTLLHGKGNE